MIPIQARAAAAAAAAAASGPPPVPLVDGSFALVAENGVSGTLHNDYFFNFSHLSSGGWEFELLKPKLYSPSLSYMDNKISYAHLRVNVFTKNLKLKPVGKYPNLHFITSQYPVAFSRPVSKAALLNFEFENVTIMSAFTRFRGSNKNELKSFIKLKQLLFYLFDSPGWNWSEAFEFPEETFDAYRAGVGPFSDKPHKLEDMINKLAFDLHFDHAQVLRFTKPPNGTVRPQAIFPIGPAKSDDQTRDQCFEIFNNSCGPNYSPNDLCRLVRRGGGFESIEADLIFGIVVS